MWHLLLLYLYVNVFYILFFYLLYTLGCAFAYTSLILL